MRIEVTFKGGIVPLSYHFLFSSLLKKAFSNSSKDKMKELYEYENKKNKKSKSLTFAVFFKDFEIKKDIVYAKDGIVWTVSSNEIDTMIHLNNGLLDIKEFKYQDYSLQFEKVRLIQEKLPQTKEATFKTLSPITIKNKNGNFISPEHLDYAVTFSYICNLILKNIRGYGLQEPIEFIPIRMKKQVVKLKHKEFEHLNNEGVLYVNAYKGTFKLKGNIEDLRLLSQVGLGFRRNQGFGMISLI